MLHKRLSRLVLLPIGVLVVVLMLARPAAALSCMPMNAAEHVARAHVIFTGTVGETSGEWAVVDVNHYYKGGGPAKVTVKTDTMWGPFLATGEQWLLYVTIGEKNVWDLGLCGASRPISTGHPLTQEETELLGEGTVPAADAEPPPSGRSTVLIWGGAGIAAAAVAFGLIRLTKAGRGQAK